MKKALLLTCCFLGALVGRGSIEALMANDLATNSASVFPFSQRDMDNLARAINVNLPQRMDEMTVLTRVGGDAANRYLRYYYDIDLSPVSDQQLQLIAGTVREFVTSTACSTKETRRLIDQGLELAYSYQTPSRQSFDFGVSSC